MIDRRWAYQRPWSDANGGNESEVTVHPRGDTVGLLGGGSRGHKQQKGGEMCRPCSTYARVSWPGSGGRQCNVYLSSLLIECFFFILVKMERAGNAWRARRASRTSEKRQRYMVWNQKSCIGSGNKIHVKGCLSRKDRKHTLGYAFSLPSYLYILIYIRQSYISIYIQNVYIMYASEMSHTYTYM